MPEKASKYLWTCRQLAAAAHVTEARIRQILQEGKKLRGEKMTGAWFVQDEEAKRWLRERLSR